MNIVQATRHLLGSSTLRGLAGLDPEGDVFLTGGALRDRLLGLRTRDLDLVVTGPPQRIAEAGAARFGARVVRLGRPPFTIWRVAAGQTQLDVWGVPGNVEADIRRRDFTVNAMLWRLPRGPLIDLVGGLDDLAAGRIQVVRAANLNDDPLRVLRGVRLASTHEHLRPTATCERHLAEAALGLRRVARERVVEELRLLLGGRGVERAILVAFRLGILAALHTSWEGTESAQPVARLAGHLAALGSLGPRLHRGAMAVAPALFAYPAVRHAGGWEAPEAVETLVSIGWSPSTAVRAAGAAAAGERLLATLGGPASAQRIVACDLGQMIEPALAWALSRARVDGEDYLANARALLSWSRRFARRAAILDGAEIAALLDLPPCPARAEAVAALRRAQAGREVRTRGQARRWVLDRGFR